LEDLQRKGLLLKGKRVFFLRGKRGDLVQTGRGSQFREKVFTGRTILHKRKRGIVSVIEKTKREWFPLERESSGRTQVDEKKRLASFYEGRGKE